MPRLLTDDEIATQLQGLQNWQRADSDGDTAISTSFELADFRAALDLVQRIGDAAEQMNHHPDIDIRWNKVRLALSTHSEGGLTNNDFELARKVDAAA
jgi:4a-hydroxytetrahydrobiopterin dehydratase